MKYYFLLLISLIFPNTFQTSLGQCTLKIYDGKIKNIPELIDIINNETNKLTRELGIIQQDSFSIHITNSLKKFNSIAGSAPAWSIAIAKNTPNKIIMKTPNVAKISYSHFLKVLKHELNHIYMFQLNKYSTIPSWFKEGIAMHFSKEFSLLHKIEISHYAWKKNLVPLIKLNKINKKNNKNITLQYAESAAAIECLIFYYGKNIIIEIFKNLHLNQDFELALENAINEDYVDFQIKFSSFLNENYKWIFLLKAGKHIYVILPFILIIGFYYKYFKNKKILKLWELEEELEN